MKDQGDRAVDVGPLMSMSEAVAQNVREVMRRRRWGIPELVVRLRQLGLEREERTVRRMTKADRGVSVDDLVLLAIALDVSPFTLMCPPREMRVCHPGSKGKAGAPVLEEGFEVVGARFVHYPGDPKYDVADGEGEGTDELAEFDSADARVWAWEQETWDRAREVRVHVPADVAERTKLIAELASPITLEKLNEVDWDWEKANLPNSERWDLRTTSQLRARLELRRRRRE